MYSTCVVILQWSLLGIALLISGSELVHGDSNISNEISPSILRELVHPANLTIESRKKRETTVVVNTPRERPQTADDGRMKCYICSWSLMGRVSNTSENVDTCSTGRFNPDTAVTISCDHGCQTKLYKHSEKDEIRQFFRNCFRPEEGKEVRERCYTTKNIYGIEQSCECLTHLCNDASPLSGRRLNSAILIVFLLLHNWA